jgi:hypothetical protein
MKRPLIGGNDLHNYHWTRRTSLRRVIGSFAEKVKLSCFFWEEEKNECVTKELICCV